MIDQSKVDEGHQVIMASSHVGERALPLAWRMKRTQSAIGFRERREALEAVAAPAEIIPIDGKSTRHSGLQKNASKLIDWFRPSPLVSAFAARQRLVLRQIAVEEEPNFDRRPWRPASPG